MSQNNGASLFITKLRERKDRNQTTYFIGSLGMATIMIRPHKTNAQEWNVFLMEPLPRDNNQQNNSRGGGNQGGGFGGGFNSGGFNNGPSFDSSEDIPF